MTLPGLTCACGNPDIFALKPGLDAVYGQARDLFGEPDARHPPVLLSAPVADVATCFACMPRIRAAA